MDTKNPFLLNKYAKKKGRNIIADCLVRIARVTEIDESKNRSSSRKSDPKRRKKIGILSIWPQAALLNQMAGLKRASKKTEMDLLIDFVWRIVI